MFPCGYRNIDNIQKMVYFVTVNIQLNGNSFTLSRAPECGFGFQHSNDNGKAVERL